MMECLSCLGDKDKTSDELFATVIKTGEMDVKVMTILGAANTGEYGNPEITEVSLDVRNNPGILTSA